MPYKIKLSSILLITPPFTQLNTPYPATAYLKGFLNTKGIDAFQMDLGIEVINTLFSQKHLKEVFDFGAANLLSDNAQRIYNLRSEYLKTIDQVIGFLQGKNQTLARQICAGTFLPQASRFEQLEDTDWAFGTMGNQDKAKHLATLYLEDLSDFIVECVDENFGFSRYAERLGRSASTFDELYAHLQEEPTYIDSISLSILEGQIKKEQPNLVCFSVPFPGNLYSAFRCAQFIKTNFPNVKIAMGGGFPNTELRSLKDARVFDFFDYITLDDGELPIELVYNNVLGATNQSILKRTFTRINNEVVYHNNSALPDYKQAEIGTPDYSDLPLTDYISVIEIANPMHSLWSDGRWNKLIMAHGCYWGKCTFCDVTLDYIKLYEPIAAKLLVDRMEEIIEQTGEHGFHFVDEAAPPTLMRELAVEIIKRELTVTWWTNIRFEKSFTQDLCLLLKASGCIAVSGGLEVASDRLLKLINKGVTVEQVAQVTHNMTEAGIMVHSYLMYGYPSQTIQETIDSLEMVRQLFELGIIQSGFWHQFALTAHSPINKNADDYGIIPDYKDITFADNDIQFKDKTGIDHSKFSFGLKKSLYNFMNGVGFDMPLSEWFDFKIPRTKISEHYIENSISSIVDTITKPNSKIVWLGGQPIASNYVVSKKGKQVEMIQLVFHSSTDQFEISLEKEQADWLMEMLQKLSIKETRGFTYSQIKQKFETNFSNFEMFWYSNQLTELRANGLLAI